MLDYMIIRAPPHDLVFFERPVSGAIQEAFRYPANMAWDRIALGCVWSPYAGFKNRDSRLQA